MIKCHPNIPGAERAKMWLDDVVASIMVGLEGVAGGAVDNKDISMAFFAAFRFCFTKEHAVDPNKPAQTSWSCARKDIAGKLREICHSRC